MSDNPDVGQQFVTILTEEMGLESNNLLEQELDYLDQIAKLTESIEDKLSRLYSAKFPKQCNSCKKTYLSRAEYLDETYRLKGRSTIYEDDIGLQEYRNCVCGSTLMVWTEDRRDCSEFGVARRQLFDVCLEKMISVTGKPESDLREILRKIFRTVMERARNGELQKAS